MNVFVFVSVWEHKWHSIIVMDFCLQILDE